MTKLSCFKAYDIRGKLDNEINEDIAYRIGRAFADYLKPKMVVVGSDVRLTSEGLKLALAKGLQDSGCDVIDIGLSGTEEIYFATSFLKADGGIEITASHNPIDYNGMKLVRKHSQPISNDSGLLEIKALAELNNFPQPLTQQRGCYQKQSLLDDYLMHLMQYIDIKALKPMKIVINSGNGAAGHVIDAIERHFKSGKVPIELIKIHNEPDGTFPHGIPNPLLPECRDETIRAVLEHKADMGVAFDGDFDRCFLFDENGLFIEGYYIVGLLAHSFLTKSSAEKIIHDPRLTWNTIDIVNSNGGIAIQSKTGHAFIKEKMREQDAIYGGEMSAHHYFRDFFYCDSGMIPWLLVTELLSKQNKHLSQLVAERIAAYPVSGEINRKLTNPKQSIDAVYDYFQSQALKVEYVDGLSMEFADWRFNLRSSNTEPVVRLNVESRQDQQLMEQQTALILSLLER